MYQIIILAVRDRWYLCCYFIDSMRYMGFVRTAALLLEQQRQKKEAENAKEQQAAADSDKIDKVADSADKVSASVLENLL